MVNVQAFRFMKKQFKFVASFVLAILISALPVLPVFAATPGKTVNASATLAYNLKGLKHNVAVQIGRAHV